MRRLSVIILFLSVLIGEVKADEGMWIPALLNKLNIKGMQEKGLKLSAEDIYSINHSCLKDAVVIFGQGCTGEIISDKGLILTNHHCGYSAIQQHSTVENDYLTNGYWANKFEEEIPTPGLTATFLVRIEDVTDRILSKLKDNMTEEDRNEQIAKESAEIEKAAKGNTHYRAMVKDFFAGNSFYLFVYEVYTDVRFVGAPPSSIGKFGGDTDNWMWPRHTGDFSMFRIYASPDGKPAEYSPNNVPLKPRHHLPISLKGAKKGDFAMTIGYPGSTDRYLSSWGIEERMNLSNQARIVVREIKQDIWLKDMKASDKIRIQYSSKYSISSNYWKNSIGMNKGLKNLNVLEKKRALEKEFTEWVQQDSNRVKKYGKVLSLLADSYTQMIPYSKAQNYLYECLLGGTEILDIAMMSKGLEDVLSASPDDKEAVDAEIQKLRERADEFYKDYSPSTDHQVFAAMLKLYAQNVDEKFLPHTFDIIKRKFKNNFQAYSDYVFAKSIFASKEKLEAVLNDPSKRIIGKDPACQLSKEILGLLFTMYAETGQFSENIDKGNRLFISGLMEMKKNEVFYPDANSTMRISYGQVGDYTARDAVKYLYYTTLKGVMEKEVPGDYEFDVPAKLKTLYEKNDYGRYCDADGTLHVCFTTNNDITGGNSGSPVINSNGELFGLAFDGNWEAMSGDVAFESELQKCINVDIRYVLFIIDKFAGCQRLIDEMTIVQ
ncbi:MAG: S46 family peptidase [Bacteroidota bacterium]|nr:S46 family peptidase [Bacteroidota bacterium]